MCVILFQIQRKKRSMDLVAKFEFPDGYIAGFKRAVSLESGKQSGVKSHGCHIFMESLIPVMFHGYLNADVWKALAELRHFYRQLYANEIKKEMMKKLEK
jgi:hypothetical protein